MVGMRNKWFSWTGTPFRKTFFLYKVKLLLLKLFRDCWINKVSSCNFFFQLNHWCELFHLNKNTYIQVGESNPGPFASYSSKERQCLGNILYRCCYIHSIIITNEQTRYFHQCDDSRPTGWALSQLCDQVCHWNYTMQCTACCTRRYSRVSQQIVL